MTINHIDGGEMDANSSFLTAAEGDILYGLLDFDSHTM